MKQTLVIGSTVTDIIVNIPRLPKTGDDIHILKQSLSIGGCAFLVSDILRHFAVPYSLCTAVGGGIYGNFVADELEKRCVPIYVRRSEKNGCCYCMVEDGGERTFIVEHGIEYTFYEEYLKNIDTESIDSVYICGLEIEEYTGMNIIEYLEKHPKYMIYFAPGARIAKIQKERMERIFAMHPLLHLNEGEALAVSGESTVEGAAEALYEKTKNSVVITLGERGAYVLENGQGSYAPPVTGRVEDTIGAGDSHMGTVIAMLHMGLSLMEAVQAANHISSAVVGKAGGVLEKEDVKRAVSQMPEKLRKKIERVQ